MPATDIGYASTAFELGNDTIQGRQPFADEMILIARSEEPCDRAKKAGRLVTPGYPTAALKGCLHFVLVAVDCDHGIERADHVDGAVIHCEHHCLFRRQCELLRGRVIRKIVRGRVVRCPFPQIPLVHPRFSGEFFNRHWASLMQGLVKTEGVAHSDQCDAYRTPEIVQHLPYELMQLCFINHVLLPLLSLCPCGFSQPQRKPVSPRTPSADLPTTSCTVIEFAGWKRPQRASR